MTIKINGSITGVEEYSRSVWIIASTPAPVDGEALTSWDFSRFLKNPVILWGHDDAALPIGLASDIEFIPGTGLKMRVTFAREAASPLAEQVWQGVRDGIIRAVSVGYDPPQERTREVEVDGVITKVQERSSALLVECSFVAIGADEDAGTEFLNPEAIPDEVLRARVSKAASDLAKARVRVQKRVKSLAGGNDKPGNGTVDPGATSATIITPKGTPEKTPAPPSALPPFIGASKNTTIEMKIDAIDHLDAGEVLRLDRSRLDSSKIERTSIGGAYIPARLSRTGVLLYRNADGSQRRELRTEAEVFKADSLATLADVPVIDISDHTKIHDPTTWRKIARGHVTAAARDGQYVGSRLVIQDQETLDAIDNGERTEISCGYRCVLDMTPGVTAQGEAYDCIQRNIRYNHAALCPPNRGRAGPDVGLRLDGTNQPAPSWSTANIDSNEGDQVMKIRFNGREYEAGSTEHMDAVEAHTKATIDAAKLESKTHLDSVLAQHNVALVAITKAKDVAEAERDTAKEALDKFNTDAKKAKEDEAKGSTEKAEEEKSRKRFRRQLERSALRFFVDDEDEDEENMDAKDGVQSDRVGEKMDAMSDRDLMLHCITKVNSKFDAKGKSDDYVQARFDSMIEQAKTERGIAGVVKAARAGVQHLDASDDDDEVTKARKKRDADAANAWKPKTG